MKSKFLAYVTDSPLQKADESRRAVLAKKKIVSDKELDEQIKKRLEQEKGLRKFEDL
nr:hypothetical protein [Candidatus Njordarchaeota archaeon]